MTRCERHDLELASCADCRPRPGVLPLPGIAPAGRPSGNGPGPWFPAAYGGDCSGCGQDIQPDDEIRADGTGGWERRECCGDYGTSGGVRLAGTMIGHLSREAEAARLTGDEPDVYPAPRIQREERIRRYEDRDGPMRGYRGVRAHLDPAWPGDSAVPFEAGVPWRGAAEADWDESRGY